MKICSHANAKQKNKSWRISSFTHFLVLYKQYLGSEGVTSTILLWLIWVSHQYIYSNTLSLFSVHSHSRVVCSEVIFSKFNASCWSAYNNNQKAAHSSQPTYYHSHVQWNPGQPLRSPPQPHLWIPSAVEQHTKIQIWFSFLLLPLPLSSGMPGYHKQSGMQIPLHCSTDWKSACFLNDLFSLRHVSLSSFSLF